MPEKTLKGKVGSRGNKIGRVHGSTDGPPRHLTVLRNFHNNKFKYIHVEKIVSRCLKEA